MAEDLEKASDWFWSTWAAGGEEGHRVVDEAGDGGLDWYQPPARIRTAMAETSTAQSVHHAVPELRKNRR